MTNRVIKNPILPGFNPDPSILRVGADFYIATSTFEWFPGVQIHHSKDMANWRLIARPLDRVSQLDIRGNPDSGGIWAPCLSYSDGVFYLIYTDVKTRGKLLDTHNFLVTAPSITGPWSEPVYLNSSGFDPSLFHDGDGRKWLVNMLWDYRENRTSFAGIVLQEYSEAEKKLIGPIENIFRGTELWATEGPHLYKRNGFYYLMVAEGGTGYGHCVTVARSQSIHGPYELDPGNPMLTAANTKATLQKAGHASIVELDDGSVYMVHLCGRPIGDPPRCILGRETAIQKCHWPADGWLRLDGGGTTPFDEVSAPNLPEHRFPKEPERIEFNDGEMPLCFQTLRVPIEDSWATLTERPGWLRLYGRESTFSRHNQSLLARRVDTLHCEAATCLDFQPETYQQMAGLVAIYDVSTHYYLFVSHDEERGRCVRMIAADKGKYSEPAGEEISIPDEGLVYFRVAFSGETLQFYYSTDGKKWDAIGPSLNATLLSDEYCNGFTGAFVGICAQDMSGRRKHADFDWFEYRARSEK